MPIKTFKRHTIKEIPETPLPAEIDDPVRPFEDEEETKNIKPIVYGVYVVLLVFGVITGFLLSRNAAGSDTANKSGNTLEVSDGKTAIGISDNQTFKDSATGVLEIGGFDGEGTHKLVREGGPSQTVYLISSVVDLDQFEGKQVTVWGQTIAARKAAWLMDVGKVEM